MIFWVMEKCTLGTWVPDYTLSYTNIPMYIYIYIYIYNHLIGKRIFKSILKAMDSDRITYILVYTTKCFDFMM
jgi:hypothetical protein